MEHSREEIIKAILLYFPAMESFIVNGDDDSNLLNFPCPNSEKFGGLVVQLDKGNIWIRSYAPYSACCMDTIRNLMDTMNWFLNDELGIAIGYENSKWVFTSYFFIDNEWDLEEGLDYEIISWSGRLDKKRMPKPY